MAKIKNLIFDLDNTLYDFSHIWKKSNRLVFEYLEYNNINELLGRLKFESIENYNEIKKYEKYFPNMGMISTLEDLIADKLYEE